MFKSVTKFVVKSTVLGSGPEIEVVEEFATEEEAETYMEKLSLGSKVNTAVGLFEVTTSLITTEMYGGGFPVESV